LENSVGKNCTNDIKFRKNPTLKPSDFEDITIPVLLSVGDKDVMVTIEQTTNAFRKLTNAQLYIMSNTMHPIEKVNVSALAYKIKLFFLILNLVY
jgi:pimeloyl-ACP methyl ester carboxylesterase